MTRTVDGMLNKISGHFLPYLLVNDPTKMLVNIMPAKFNDEIHDAWATVIEPVDNGDLSERNKKIAGLDQPHIMP